MTTVQFVLRSVSRLAVSVGVLWGIAACDGIDGDDATSDEVSGAIVNGNPAGGVGVVRLRLTNGVANPDGTIPGQTCTGTVISSDRVITAGHCVDKWMTIKDGGDSTVLLQGDLLAGAEYTNDGTNFFCLQAPTRADCRLPVLSRVHVTRLGNGSLQPDVAVVRFATPFQGIKSSHFRQLSTAEPRVRQSLEVWGAGLTDPAGTETGPMLRAVTRVTSVAAKTFKFSNSRAQILPRRFGGAVVRRPERSDRRRGVARAGQEWPVRARDRRQHGGPDHARGDHPHQQQQR